MGAHPGPPLSLLTRTFPVSPPDREELGRTLAVVYTGYVMLHYPGEARQAEELTRTVRSGPARRLAREGPQ
jgi:hypothetical protein